MTFSKHNLYLDSIYVNTDSMYQNQDSTHVNRPTATVTKVLKLTHYFANYSYLNYCCSTVPRANALSLCIVEGSLCCLHPKAQPHTKLSYIQWRSWHRSVLGQLKKPQLFEAPMKARSCRHCLGRAKSACTITLGWQEFYPSIYSPDQKFYCVAKSCQIFSLGEALPAFPPCSRKGAPQIIFAIR